MNLMFWMILESSPMRIAIMNLAPGMLMDLLIIYGGR